MAMEIVDLPMDSMVIFHSYVSLPEGTWLVLLQEGTPLTRGHFVYS